MEFFEDVALEIAQMSEDIRHVCRRFDIRVVFMFGRTIQLRTILHFHSDNWAGILCDTLSLKPHWTRLISMSNCIEIYVDTLSMLSHYQH